MTLDRLWAGWRSTYVSSTGATGATGETGATGATGATGETGAPSGGPLDCVFCRIASSGPPSPENGVLWVGAEVFAVLNAYPYASGHLMVLPLRHVCTLSEMSQSEGTELWDGLRKGVGALEVAYSPDGLNLGANLGHAAGAGIPEHVHVHVVPRWIGDTNFMTAVADTRVLPETLTASWERLHAARPR